MSIATSIAGLFLFIYINKLTADKGAEIVTGLIRGQPLSTRYRRLLLNQYWIPFTLSGFACAVGLALGNMTIARCASDATITPFVQLLAFAFAVGAFFMIVGSIVVFVELRTVIRQADAD